MRNHQVKWGEFSPDEYARNNYSGLTDEDRWLIRETGSFFRNAFRYGTPAGTGVDVGAGSNMYPTLAMLPWCEQVFLFDQSSRNVEWLRSEIADLGRSWEPFWSEFASVGYEPVDFTRVRDDLMSRASPEHKSVFNLSEEAYDIGTMFFVAESMTDDESEFEVATEKFLRSLRPGAPFAAAFMKGSTGYQVGEVVFPAVSVGANEVCEALWSAGQEEYTLRTAPKPMVKIRPGYDGMMLVTGFKNQQRKEKE